MHFFGLAGMHCLVVFLIIGTLTLVGTALHLLIQCHLQLHRYFSFRYCSISRVGLPQWFRLKIKLSVVEVADGNVGALAAGIAVVVAATMQLFVCTRATSYVGSNRTHTVRALLKEIAHLTMYQGVPGCGKRSNE